MDIQAELGATRAAAFDVSAACSGWLYALTVGEGLIQAGSAETVLVVGAEKMSSIVDWTDRGTCVLFGDGAGATVLKRATKGRGILSAYMRSDGTLAELLYRPHGGATVPMSAEGARGPDAPREDGGPRGLQARRALDGRRRRPRARRRAAHRQRHRPA